MSQVDFAAKMILLSIAALMLAPQDAPLLGFSPEHARAELALEQRFDSVLERTDLRNWMRRLTARPHHLGSPYGKQNAEFIRDLFASWGYDSKIESFQVLFATPKTRLLELTGRRKFRATLEEPVIADDNTSSFVKEALPPYNVYSCDGDVTGKLVYVNYGVPQDYEELDAHGIDVRGKIVIARYGGSWRGIKPKVAAEHGAVGCIIYSDPRDDGYFQGDTYPQGSFRNREGVQRGSVADMPVYPGDPSTPGVGSIPGAKRLELKDISTITKIPTLPISYGDALPLLRSLRGAVAPDSWRGALPLTYHIGPSNRDVHLKLEFNWKLVEAHDIIATMKGTDLPDEWVIRGNHQDAWVMGAEDPISGQVAMLEEAKALGILAKDGSKPRRTVMFCAWDGEEPGLLGSTEWVETHAEELSQKAAVYINSDSNGRGYLGAEGSHTLEVMLNQVARDVIDPEKGISVAARLRARNLVNGDADAKALARTSQEFRIGALGSGSDFSSFLQHLGIASANLGYGGESAGGSYHSLYDSFDHFTRFIDPEFSYGITLSKTAGRAVLRCANADVLPMEFTHFADTVDRYVHELISLTDSMRSDTEQTNKILRDGTLDAVQDPTKPYVLPQPKPPVPYLDFAPLQNAVARLKAATKKYDPFKLTPVDDVLIKSERTLLGPGLPSRPWYRHTIYAPGLYTGYGVKTIPGVREAIEQRDWTQAQAQITQAAEALDRLSVLLEKLN